MKCLKKGGIAYIISSPSGGGKSSLIKEICIEFNNIWRSVSMTTRKPRNKEVDSKDYYFVTKEEFEKTKNGGGLLEHATVYGNEYGIPKSIVLEKLQQNTDVIFEIDWQGAINLRSALKNALKNYFAVVSIYILPPSFEELEKRLISRKDDIGVIKKRMLQAESECSHCNEYDYVIVNDDFNNSLHTLMTIITAEKHKTNNLSIYFPPT